MTTYNVITLDKHCDGEAMDGLSWKFGADWNYETRKITFIGTPERFQELLRAVRVIAKPVDVKSYENGSQIPVEATEDTKVEE